jgi:hypothetical protein
MSTVLDRAVVCEQWRPKSRLPILAKAASTAFYDPLTAVASKDGICSSMVQMEDGTLQRTSFKGRINGPKAEYARTVKSVIAAFFNEQEVTPDRIVAFREAARKLDGTTIVVERLTHNLIPVGDRKEYKIEGLSSTATALITAYELQRPRLP